MNKPADPFAGLDIEQICELPEREYRLFLAHQIDKMQTKLNYLCKRPEILRATLALIAAGASTVCAIAAVFISLRGG